MNAKIRDHNIPPAKKDVWEREHEAWLRKRSEEAVQMFREVLTQRVIVALTLAASDQLHFGPKRAQRLVGGVVEIIMGEAFDSIGRGEEIVDGIDPTLDAMLIEASTRGLYPVMRDVPGYRTVEEIAARLGPRYERGLYGRKPMEWRVKKEPAPEGTGADKEKGEK